MGDISCILPIDNTRFIVYNVITIKRENKASQGLKRVASKPIGSAVATEEYEARIRREAKRSRDYKIRVIQDKPRLRSCKLRRLKPITTC